MKKFLWLIPFIAVLTSCLPEWQGNGEDRVAIFGDSISEYSNDEYVADLTDNHQIINTARAGDLFGNQYDDFAVLYEQQYPNEMPDKVVIELGTNDAFFAAWGQYNLFFTFLYMDAFYNEFPNACLYFVTVNSNTLSQGYRDYATEINNWWKAKSDVNIIDWDAFLSTHTYLLYDQIHPDDEGQQILSDMIESATESC